VELTKEALQKVPLKKLIQTYALLSEEIPVLKDAAYLELLDLLLGEMGEEAIVTGGSVDGNSYVFISVNSLPKENFADLALLVQYANAVHGFDITFVVKNPDPDALKSSYEVRIEYLPLKLSWVWESPTVDPIRLKTIVKKLKQ